MPLACQRLNLRQRHRQSLFGSVRVGKTMRLQTFMSVPKNEPLSRENFDRRPLDGDRKRDREYEAIYQTHPIRENHHLS